MNEFTIDQVGALREVELALVRRGASGLRVEFQSLIEQGRSTLGRLRTLEQALSWQPCVAKERQSDFASPGPPWLTVEELLQPNIGPFLQALRQAPRGDSVVHHGIQGRWSPSFSLFNWSQPAPDTRIIRCWGSCGGQGFDPRAIEAGAFCSACDGHGLIIVYANWDKILPATTT